MADPFLELWGTPPEKAVSVVVTFLYGENASPKSKSQLQHKEFSDSVFINFPEGGLSMCFDKTATQQELGAIHLRPSTIVAITGRCNNIASVDLNERVLVDGWQLRWCILSVCDSP